MDRCHVDAVIPRSDVLRVESQWVQDPGRDEPATLTLPRSGVRRESGNARAALQRHRTEKPDTAKRCTENQGTGKERRKLVVRLP